VGRGDQQVKVRGHRVELGEIENALLSHPDVVQAAARTFPDAAGQPVIALYAVPRPGSTPPGRVMRDFLRERLPDPMLPGSITVLAALPLTGNGKLDRAALPPPDLFGPALSRSFVAPRTDAERALAAVISEVLGIRNVGVDDNLFELGCDSMRTVQVVAVASSNGLRVQLQDLYRHPTVARLAAVVSAR
jgi:aryl carrier-like protein